MEKYIYCVKAISLREKTNEDRELALKISNLRYNREQTLESFEKFLKSWGEYTYEVDSFISSYHDTLEEALQYVIFNVADINEAGCYNYASVERIPLGCSYYNCNQNKNEDFYIYKYNHEKDSYEELNKEAKEYQKLLYHCWGMSYTDEEPK